MARTLKADKTLFLLTLLLVGASVVMVYSASAVKGSYFLYKQLAWAALGFGVLFATMRVDYHLLRRPSLIWAGLGVSVVLLVAVFFAPEINGTNRWLPFRYASVQPSELAKLVAIVFTAAVLERRMHRIGDVLYGLAPIVVVTFVLATLIVLEPDFGTSVALVLVVGSMLFAAGLRYAHIVTAGLMLAPVAVVVVMSADYRMRRILAFLHPETVRNTDGFQLVQSLIAIGSGGWFGRGLGGSIQKLFYLPEAHTDFIFAIIGEELGLIGTTVVLLAFGMLAWRGLRIALRAPDRFGSLLAVGITMMVALQAFLNITVVTGLAPTKGLPLPFVSNGGSSLLINMVAMGILLNISQQASAVAMPGASRRAGWVLGGQEA